MTTHDYLITFDSDRIGRTAGVGKLTVTAATPDDIARRVFKFARSFLLSSGVDVVVDLDKDGRTGRGSVYVGGYRTVAKFDVQLLVPAVPAP